MHTATQIAETHANLPFSFNWLSAKEKDFVVSVYAQSQRPAFAGLSPKQESWLSAIERKLTARKKQFAENYARRRRAYVGVCMSW